jgi:hypothetical protein
MSTITNPNRTSSTSEPIYRFSLCLSVNKHGSFDLIDSDGGVIAECLNIVIDPSSEYAKHLGVGRDHFSLRCQLMRALDTFFTCVKYPYFRRLRFPTVYR